MDKGRQGRLGEGAEQRRAVSMVTNLRARTYEGKLLETGMCRELGLVYETAEDRAGKLEVEEKVRAMADKS